MKNAIISISILSMLFLFSGCSHNTFAYSDGIGLETTINPQTYTLGLNFRYGKIFTGVFRENTEIKMVGNGNVKGALSSNSIIPSTSDTSSTTTKTGTDNSTASSDATLYIKVGKQITGYMVDLANVDKSFADKLVENYINDSKSTDKSINSDTSSVNSQTTTK